MIDNLNKVYNSREKVINLFRDYIEMLSDANYDEKQRNNSESLLNEIRQIVYSLYQSKQITKKVYNNIIKSINI